MDQTATSLPAATATAAPKSLPARIVGVLLAPRATYADIAARPRWLGVFLFIALFGAACTFTFLSTEIGRQAMLDQQYRAMDSVKAMGVNIPDAAYDQVESRVDSAKYTGPLGQIGGLALSCLIIAGIAMAVFNAIMGGDATFKQVFSVVTHSAVVLSVSQAFGMPLAYARETMSGATNLAVFAPFLDENSFAARALGSVDLFILWWAVSLAIGLGVLYKRRTGPIAITLIVLYVVIGVVIAAVRTAVSGA